MATTWAQVSLEASGEEQSQPTADDRGRVTTVLQQIYTVVTDQTSKGTVTEAATANVTGGDTLPPMNGVITAGDGTLYLVTSKLARRTGPYSFTVQVTGKQTPYVPTDGSKFNVDISIGGQGVTEETYFDKDGHAIVNSAHQPFNPSPSRTYYDERIDVKYSSTSDQSLAFAAVRGRVNGSAISFNIRGINRSFQPRQLQCLDVQQSITVPAGTGTANGSTGTVNGSGGTLVYNVSASFIARTQPIVTGNTTPGLNGSSGFTTWIVDKGRYALNTDSGAQAAANTAGVILTLAQITDSAGQHVSEDVWLDGHGGQPTASSETVQPVFLPFKVEPEADFTAIFTGLV